MSAKYDLIIKQGSTFNMSGQFIDAATNTPRDITGYSIRSQLRENYTSSLAASFTSSITSEVSGTWNIELPAYISADLTAGCYVYDIELYNSASVDRFLEGDVKLTPEVTRD